MKKALLFVIILSVLSEVSIAVAEQPCVTTSGFAAYSEEVMKKLMEYIHHKDNVAAQKLYNQGLIFSLKEGIPVYISKRRWSELIRFRPVGQNTEFWTIRGVIKCPD